MTNSLRLLPILTTFILAGCASRSPAPSSFPEKFAVNSGGFFGDSFAITREGNRLLYRRFSAKLFRAQTIRFSPSDQQWKAFWAEAEAVSLWKWKPSYEPSCIVNDGTRWSIEIEHQGRKVTSEGDNAYPGDHSPGAKSTKPSKRYTRFLSAIRSLAGGREFY